MKLLMTAILMACLLSSCKNSEPKTYLDLFERQAEVGLSPFDGLASDSLMSPDNLLAMDDYLILSEPELPNLLAVYHFKDNSFKRFLSKGHGQNEAVNIQALGLLNHRNSFYAHDVMSQSAFLIEMTDSIERIHKDSLSFSRSTVSLAYDGDLAFYMLSGDSTRFVVRNKQQQISLGDFPEVEGISPQVLSQSIQGPSLLSFKNKKLTWFSGFNDMMEIYDYSDPGRIRLEKSRVINLPVYDQSVERNSGVLDATNKVSVFSITADERYIYALYNENQLKDFAEKGRDVFYCNKILVFDWEGNPITLLNVDRAVRTLTYRKEDRRIYCLGLTADLNPMIYYFEVKTDWK